MSEEKKDEEKKDEELENIPLKKKKKEGKRKFFEIFSKYFWSAIVIVLVSIIIQENLDKTTAYYLTLSILATFFSTLGLTLIVASLFTYTLGTKEFIDYIEDKLESIIIGRNFLANMDSERKEEALHAILKSSKSQKKIYSNIDEYYEYYIHDVMNVSKKNVRSDYKIRADIMYDPDKKRVYADGSVQYRLYPSDNGYVPITLGIDKDNLSKCKRLDIFDAEGKLTKIDVSKLNYIETKESETKTATVELNSYDFKADNHLTIEIDFTEYGFNHWMAFKFLIFQPTDGINLEIKCFDDISLKERKIFDITSKYHTSIDEEQHFKISSHQWVQEGSGFMLIVSKPELRDVSSVDS